MAYGQRKPIISASNSLHKKRLTLPATLCYLPRFILIFFFNRHIDEAIDRHPVSPSTPLVTLILCRRSACTDPPVVFKFSPKEEKNCYKSGPLFLISYKALAWFSRILALTKSLQTVINYKFKCDYKMGVTKNRRIQTFVLYKSFDSLHCIDWLLSIKAIQPFKV